MILVDTSVWIYHLGANDSRLVSLLRICQERRSASSSLHSGLYLRIETVVRLIKKFGTKAQ